MNGLIAYGVANTKNRLQVVAKLDDKIINLSELCNLGVLKKELAEYFIADSLNRFITLGPKVRREIKQEIVQFLRNSPKNCASAIIENNQIQLRLPVAITGYTDFYASKEHATNIGKIFRPDNPLMPNWVHMPIAYNGRASSVMLSGHPVKRPYGQILVDGVPCYSQAKKLDFEVELGIIIGKGNDLGNPININTAHEHIFGICLINDWSARDIQAWEYQPLGPFNSKSFLTSMSAFITPIEELDDFKVAAIKQDPSPMGYLLDKNSFTYDIKLDVGLKENGAKNATTISQVNFKDIYWTMSQWISQHTVSGCNLQVGDLLASGTISGQGLDHCGSLMEITVNGTKPLQLESGEKRTFLENGDELVISAYCEKEAKRFDLGSVSGKIEA